MSTKVDGPLSKIEWQLRFDQASGGKGGGKVLDKFPGIVFEYFNTTRFSKGVE